MRIGECGKKKKESKTANQLAFILFFFLSRIFRMARASEIILALGYISLQWGVEMGGPKEFEEHFLPPRCMRCCVLQALAKQTEGASSLDIFARPSFDSKNGLFSCCFLETWMLKTCE